MSNSGEIHLHVYCASDMMLQGSKDGAYKFDIRAGGGSIQESVRSRGSTGKFNKIAKIGLWVFFSMILLL